MWATDNYFLTAILSFLNLKIFKKVSEFQYLKFPSVTVLLKISFINVFTTLKVIPY